MKNRIDYMTVKDFRTVPYRTSYDSEEIMESVVLLPGYKRPLHESGYRLIDFVSVKGGRAVCRLSGCSDVLNFNGIGGYGLNSASGKEKIRWNMDCLKVSGLFRIWADGHYLKAGLAVSSFELFLIERK